MNLILRKAGPGDLRSGQSGQVRGGGGGQWKRAGLADVLM
jgi:hypothetical protein